MECGWDRWRKEVKKHNFSKHNVSQWKKYWVGPLTSYVRENLKHKMLHDVAINIRATHKTSDVNTNHKVTPDSVMKNTINSDATLLKTRQSSVLSYDADTVKRLHRNL